METNNFNIKPITSENINIFENFDILMEYVAEKHGISRQDLFLYEDGVLDRSETPGLYTIVLGDKNGNMHYVDCAFDSFNEKFVNIRTNCIGIVDGILFKK